MEGGPWPPPSLWRPPSEILDRHSPERNVGISRQRNWIITNAHAEWMNAEKRARSIARRIILPAVDSAGCYPAALPRDPACMRQVVSPTRADTLIVSVRHLQ